MRGMRSRLWKIYEKYLRDIKIWNIYEIVKDLQESKNYFKRSGNLKISINECFNLLKSFSGEVNEGVISLGVSEEMVAIVEQTQEKEWYQFL